MSYEAVIGLEIHVELQTRSKMFCACPVVDSVSAQPNSAVCPICAGMPGTLPVANRMAVEYGLRVALALGCTINPLSIFARKNYFYPDLPKGYQISQYEQPLAERGLIHIETSQGERTIRIRRVHLEEDTGKLTHHADGYSLVDFNRAGVPLLEIVTEPDFHSAEQVRAYAETLRTLVRYLGVNSGELEKGVMRIEPNISVRQTGQTTLGTKVEIKNLNSLRALERGTAYEIERQIGLLTAGKPVQQQTVGWDEARQVTVPQRSKEDAHDYRYFPEPDLPPLHVSAAWADAVRADLPELPWQRRQRYLKLGLPAADAQVLSADRTVGAFFDRVLDSADVLPRFAANWISGELFARMNESGLGMDQIPISPKQFGELLQIIEKGAINANTGKMVLAEMFDSGRSAAEIVNAQGLGQLSDGDEIARLVTETLQQYPDEVMAYRAGKTTVLNWLFGQVMRKAAGRANPQVVRAVLEKQLG